MAGGGERRDATGNAEGAGALPPRMVRSVVNADIPQSAAYATGTPPRQWFRPSQGGRPDLFGSLAWPDARASQRAERRASRTLVSVRLNAVRWASAVKSVPVARLHPCPRPWRDHRRWLSPTRRPIAMTEKHDDPPMDPRGDVRTRTAHAKDPRHHDLTTIDDAIAPLPWSKHASTGPNELTNSSAHRTIKHGSRHVSAIGVAVWPEFQMPLSAASAR